MLLLCLWHATSVKKETKSLKNNIQTLKKTSDYGVKGAKKNSATLLNPH